MGGAGNTVIAGTINNSGGLNMDGSGTLTITGYDINSGTTGVSAGILQVAAGGVISGSGAVTVTSGTLSISGGLVATSNANGLFVGTSTGLPATLSVSAGTLGSTGISG